MIQSLAQQANDAYLMWGFILAAAALGLLIIELLIPSGGLLGVLCGIAAIGSIVAFFQYDMMFGVVSVLAYIVLTPILLVFVFKLWIQSPLAKRLVLGGDTQGQTDGEQDTLKTAEKARLKRLEELRRLIGAEGVTVTDLRPVGFVKIDGQRLDAMAESGVVDANTPVVVTDVYDNQIKVRPCTP
ncbi:MAG: NfeD family protein [Planctomycetota bacterium]|jgi:membrane-bound serine protease (ClpP class)